MNNLPHINVADCVLSPQHSPSLYHRSPASGTTDLLSRGLTESLSLCFLLNEATCFFVFLRLNTGSSAMTVSGARFHSLMALIGDVDIYGCCDSAGPGAYRRR